MQSNTYGRFFFIQAIWMIPLLVLSVSCGSTARYQLHSKDAAPPDQLAVLEEEIPDRGRVWTILIDKEDVHAARVNFWSIKGKNSRIFELLPGNHEIVAAIEYTLSKETVKGIGVDSVYATEALYSPIRMVFLAERGKKYLIGGRMDKNYRWETWIKDAASNETVSRVVPPDPGNAEVLGQMCRIDSKQIISSVKIEDILYFPMNPLLSRILDASQLTENPVGKVMIDTVFKTLEAGQVQYRKAYIVSVDVSNQGYVLVPREGLMLDEKISGTEMFKNMPRR